MILGCHHVKTTSNEHMNDASWSPLWVKVVGHCQIVQIVTTHYHMYTWLYTWNACWYHLYIPSHAVYNPKRSFAKFEMVLRHPLHKKQHRGQNLLVWCAPKMITCYTCYNRIDSILPRRLQTSSNKQVDATMGPNVGISIIFHICSAEVSGDASWYFNIVQRLFSHKKKEKSAEELRHERLRQVEVQTNFVGFIGRTSAFLFHDFCW